MNKRGLILNFFCLISISTAQVVVNQNEKFYTCGGDENGENGIIESPEYNQPNGYPSDLNCNWRVTVPQGKLVQLEFISIDVEVEPKLCPFDGVIIYDVSDGITINDVTKQANDSFFLGKTRYCGEGPFPPILSKSNEVEVLFYSDADTSGKGFQLEWKAVEKPADVLDCTFDNGLCYGWRNLIAPDDVFDWELQSGKTKTQSTGPDYDHTTKNSSGQYIFIEASLPQQINDTAIIITPNITFLPQETTMCLTFWYNMYGRHTGKLAVAITVGSDSTITWFRDGQQGLDWIEGEIQIPYQNTPFQIMFIGIRGQGFAGDTALDDVMFLRNTTCPTIVTTTTIEPPFPEKTTFDNYQTFVDLTTQPSTSCSANKYACLDGYTCIPSIFVCDGLQDCPDNDDENNCTDINVGPPPGFTTDVPDYFFETTDSFATTDSFYFTTTDVFEETTTALPTTTPTTTSPTTTSSTTTTSTATTATTIPDDITTTSSTTTTTSSATTTTSSATTTTPSATTTTSSTATTTTTPVATTTTTADVTTTSPPADVITTTTSGVIVNPTTTNQTTAATGCPDNYLSCSDGNCISILWICDGMLDCTDGEDEFNCPTPAPVGGEATTEWEDYNFTTEDPFVEITDLPESTTDVIDYLDTTTSDVMDTTTDVIDYLDTTTADVMDTTTDVIDYVDTTTTAEISMKTAIADVNTRDVTTTSQQQVMETTTPELVVTSSTTSTVTSPPTEPTPVTSSSTTTTTTGAPVTNQPTDAGVAIAIDTTTSVLETTTTPMDTILETTTTPVAPPQTPNFTPRPQFTSVALDQTTAVDAGVATAATQSGQNGGGGGASAVKAMSLATIVLQTLLVVLFAMFLSESR